MRSIAVLFFCVMALSACATARHPFEVYMAPLPQTEDEVAAAKEEAKKLFFQYHAIMGRLYRDQFETISSTGTWRGEEVGDFVYEIESVCADFIGSAMAKVSKMALQQQSHLEVYRSFRSCQRIIALLCKRDQALCASP